LTWKSRAAIVSTMRSQIGTAQAVSSIQYENVKTAWNHGLAARRSRPWASRRSPRSVSSDVNA